MRPKCEATNPGIGPTKRSQNSSQLAAVTARPGPKPSFSKDDVVNAALKMNLHEFTMAQLARTVGTVPSALYRLFASRDAVLTACLDRIAENMDLGRIGSGSTPRNQSTSIILKEYAEVCWRTMEQYPGLSQVLTSNPNAPRSISEPMEKLITNLTKRGVSRGQALFALDFLGDLAISTHLAIQPYRQMDAAQQREHRRRGGTWAMRSYWLDRGSYDQKVDFVIRGLESDWPEME
ncbi:TetR/AcrR family transcriptional regulator [Gleimia hominis]|uniref:TetR/AcrR family transcriptional regulator n=1 Tax=Gleimia hominis TaxID=595468 RepID=UPI0011AF947D|nr:TetR/AcrR family transcriptional regulator [Gleimia hominis]WIK65185.1 TetR/AcrR family transcriptional regulator [Gleimia hominis]